MTRRILSLAALSLGVVASVASTDGGKDCDTATEDCDTGTEADADPDADADSDTDADSDADSDADTDITVMYGWKGEADVSPSTSYSGWEQFYITDVSTGENYCVHEWDFDNTAVLTDCADCDWAFEVTGTNGAIAEGDCAQSGAPESTAGPYNYGYGQIDYNGNAYDVLFYGAGGSWGYVALASFDGSTFVYDWLYGYAYY